MGREAEMRGGMDGRRGKEEGGGACEKCCSVARWCKDQSVVLVIERS